MGKICWINGQPYSVGLPTGGENNHDFDNQWDKIIDFLGEDCDDVFHWGESFSWCQNVLNGDTSCRAVRGYGSARNQFSNFTALFGSRIGFRPILTPLNPNTLKPNRSLLVDIPDGWKIALSSLYMEGKPVDLSEERGPNYKAGAKIILGDRDKNKNNWLYVIKYKDLLWADRNVLVNISWEDLRKQGYTDCCIMR